MSPRKPVLYVAVDREVKTAFEAAAIDRRMKTAHLLGVLVDEYLHRAPPILPESTATDTVKTHDVRVRLTSQKYDELLRLASAHQWHRSTYLCYLFDVHLSGKPKFDDTELLALRQLTRQITALGNNVNQIAHALNTSLDNAHLVQSVDFAEMKKLLDLERTAVKALVRSNLKKWNPKCKTTRSKSF